MPLDYDRLMSLPPREERGSYGPRDAILYALGVGVGVDDPTSWSSLRYTYETGLQLLPTMAVIIGSPGFWLMEPQYGVDWQRVLHGEQSVELCRPLPVAAEVVSRLRIDAIYDKGAAKGAILYATREIFEAGAGVKLATLKSTSFLRGDGGFGGKAEGAPKPHVVPDHRAPDLTTDVRTRADQALLYRLSGDWNPLHIDPAIARRAGFERPILHGLCTYGIVGRALLANLCSDEAGAFRKFAVRFSNPVFPGETIRIEIWQQSQGLAAVRARVVERDVRVVDNGVFEYQPTG
jgi:acyl dehydratase